MLLFDYMDKHKISRQKLAREIGYSDSTLDQYFRSVRVVNARFALAVETYTKGAVKANELIERSKKNKEMHDELLRSPRKYRPETYVSCYGVCKMCKKKLKENGL